MYYGSDYGVNGFSNIFDSVSDVLRNLGNIATFHTILGFILGIGLIVLWYIIYSYVIMFQGRKAKLDNDWYAFIPIVRTVYRLDMVGEDRWKILFIGGLANIIKGLLIFLLILFVLMTNAIFSIFFDIIVLGYMGLCVYFNYKFNIKLYRLFNYNENLAFINLSASISNIFLIVGALGGWLPLLSFATICGTITGMEYIYMMIFNFTTAFDNRCVTIYDISSTSDSNSKIVEPNRGQIMCTAGMYRDAVFKMDNDIETVLGRDSYFASIIINEGAGSVSRKHCGIRYDASSKDYIVTDYSSNGTYIADTGERLPKNTPKHLSKGTSIYLGDKNNRFKLL